MYLDFVCYLIRVGEKLENATNGHMDLSHDVDDASHMISSEWHRIKNDLSNEHILFKYSYPLVVFYTLLM